jgi:hypothetical protein
MALHFLVAALLGGVALLARNSDMFPEKAVA